MNLRYCEHGVLDDRCMKCSKKEYSQKEVDLIVAGMQRIHEAEMERIKKRVEELEKALRIASDWTYVYACDETKQTIRMTLEPKQ